MKQLCLLIAAIAVISCKQEAPIDYAILSGSIQNNSATEFEVRSTDGSILKKITIDETGNFTDTLTVTTPLSISFYDGVNYDELYLSTGNNITISYDANDFKNTLTFSGIGAEISNYLLEKSSKTEKMKGERKDLFVLEEVPFKTKISAIKTAQEALIAEAEGISEAYKTLENRNINYEYISTLNQYERAHAYYVKNPDFKVSEGFVENMDGFDYNNEADMAFSPIYNDLVSNHYNEKSQELVKSDTLPGDVAYLKTVGAIESEAIRNVLLWDKANSSISYTRDLEAFYSAFMVASTNENQKAKLTVKYDQLKLLAKGAASPKFIDYENHAGGTSSLDDFKGKFVYIDVWATWCGPCKAEIPFLQEVEKAYHGKNIEFISVSIDTQKNKDKWKKMVSDMKLGGVQLIADNEWSSEFVKSYLINGIPRFILIDTEGNIVSKNAPRPSDSKLISLFDEMGI